MSQHSAERQSSDASPLLISEQPTYRRALGEDELLLESKFSQDTPTSPRAEIRLRDHVVNLRLTRSFLTITRAHPRTGLFGRFSMPNTARLCVHEFVTCESTMLDSTDQYGLLLFTCIRTKKHVWRPIEYVFVFSSQSIRDRWLQTITSFLQDLPRPRRLLILVNPHSGKRKAVRVYQSTAYIYAKAGIVTEVVHTTRANHANDIMAERDLTAFDGCVVYGGDGTLNEALHGLYRRTDGHTIPMAVIPSGSTDTVACSLHGTRDAVTAVVHVVLGDQHQLDIGAIHTLRDPSNERFFSNMLTYGFFSDVVTTSEKMRFLGPFRYDVAGAITWIRHRPFQMKVEFQRSTTHQQHVMCHAPCTTCRSSAVDLPASAAATAAMPWETAEGEFQSISLASISLINDKSVKGYVPDAHLADGVSHLVLVRKCSRMDYLRFLIRVAHTGKQFDFPFVERIPVTSARFRPIGGPILERDWAVDGEALKERDVDAKIAAHSLTVFARGIEHEDNASIHSASTSAHP